MLSLNEKLDRLSTFKDWPIDAPIRPAELVNDGFYYTGRNDTVKCFRCQTELRRWRRGDHPSGRHRRANAVCPVVTNRDTLNAEVHMSSDVSLQRLELDDLQQTIPPVNRSRPDDRSWQNLRLQTFRLQTFHDWSNQHVNALDLARAGFFFSGVNDMVQCAFCRRRLNDWKNGDIPTEEHRLFAPTCPFVGQNFCCLAPSVGTISGQQRQADEQARRTLKEIKAENEDLRRERLCPICMENEFNRVLSKCGHLLCGECLSCLQSRHCHMCRAVFDDSDVKPCILPH